MNAAKLRALLIKGGWKLPLIIAGVLLWGLIVGRVEPTCAPDLDRIVDRRVIQFHRYDFTVVTQAQQGHLDVNAIAEVEVISDRVHQIQFMLTDLYQITIQSLKINGRELDYRHVGDIYQVDLPFSCFKGKKLTLTLNYRMERVTITPEVLAELRGNWYPKNILPEPATAVFKLDVPDGYIGVANGNPLKVVRKEDRRVFYWNLREPTTSFGVSIGKYQQLTRTINGRPFHLYYLPAIEAKIIRNVIDWSRGIFQCYLNEFGGTMPDNFTVVLNDTPLGESAFGSLIYLHYRSPDLSRLLLHPQDDRKMLFNGLAHEIAHYWWGNLVIPKNVYDWWLVEGFATYSAAFAGWQLKPAGMTMNSREDLKGWRERYCQTIDNLNRYQVPEMPLAELSPFDIQRELLYSKGPFVLVMIRQQLGKSNMQRYLKRFVSAYTGKPVGVREFTRMGVDLFGAEVVDFFRQWVYSTGTYNLALEEVSLTPVSGGVQLRTTIKNVGQLSLPDRVRLEIITEDRVYVEVLQFKGVNDTIQKTLPVKPLKITVNARDEVLEMDHRDNFWD